MSKNTNLHKAKKEKNDEFFTQLSDIEKELKHYKDHFVGKTVYCNCDDARESNFFKYFSMNFEHLGLKKLICTGYKKDGHGVVLVYEGDKNGNRVVDDEEITVTEMEGDGDFRSEECVKLLEEADIVVTNPPFSLFREYVAQLVEHGKKFLILGNFNAIKYKEIFPLIKENNIWIGVSIHSGDRCFTIPADAPETKYGRNENGEKINRVMVRWFTNLDHTQRHEKLILVEEYSPEKYPKFDNYDAINVNKVNDIPKNYSGVMGVPISYFDKHCPEQFEIVGTTENGLCDKSLWINPDEKHNEPFLNGKKLYTRILIKAKTPAA